jgi:hypothetical protein
MATSYALLPDASFHDNVMSCDHVGQLENAFQKLAFIAERYAWRQ